MKLNLATLQKRQPIPAPRVISPLAPEAAQVIETETRVADAVIAEADEILSGPIPATKDELVRESQNKLSRLIDHDFPFDESQLAAINGMKNQKHACLTGAAGTGKTTCLKKLVDDLQDVLTQVDMSTYFKSGYKPDDAEDDYEAPENYVPSICLAAFTGRASQMIKKNFPRDWHGNIMTIHRMLAYMPEYYEEWDEVAEEIRNKMRFIPTYNVNNKMPWDIIIIDEAGMVGIDLYHEVLAALKPGARLYMVGDINQLPPTHGRSVFGFAMGKWPSWELTHIHRQVGVNNSIVDNAWRVLKGQTPKSDDVKDPSWKFAMMKLPGDSQTASRHLRAWLKKIAGKQYDPIRDTIITPINAYEQTTGYALGQDPLNRELAIMFNAQTEENPRYIIDAGRDRKYFAVGDKVMATRNDHEAGITNGMTGIITGIARNGLYRGDSRRFDTIDNVNQYLNTEAEDDDEEFTLDDLTNHIESEQAAKEKQEKETRDRGPASHIVTIRFGEGDHSFEMPFATLAEVASLMMAYVVTCHKMQGGESPMVIIICHQAHKRMLFREWLYTAITRASQKCVVLYTEQGLASALGKQNIKGVTLAQKVEAFQALQEKGLTGAAVRVTIPEPESFSRELAVSAPRTMLEQIKDARNQALDELNHLGEAAPSEATEAPRVKLNGTFTVRVEYVEGREPRIIDGGDLTNQVDVIPAPKPEFILGESHTHDMTGIGRFIRMHRQRVKRLMLPAPAPQPVKPKVGLKLNLARR